ncbi:MAG: nucleotide exchange factor GrpE [Methanolinea sp.]|nr:nucleotide exchange factor GrpE [Methanolinea sp.]
MDPSKEEEFIDSDEKKEQESPEKKDDVPPADQGNADDEIQRKYEELNDRFLRLAADFDNYRKRMEREIQTRTRYALEGFAVDLLEVADNFERALSADPSSARDGLEQIHKLFGAILERHGVVPIGARGRKFDPSEHEAVACVPSDEEEGTVVDEVCCGYRMHDRVIRCAKVTVAKKKESE